MMVFYCDLDNTLIYSHSRDIGADKVGVECYQGKEISFMTQASATMLAEVRKQMLFVPTTTRTVEQYERVRLGGQAPEYALVCNGGVLLRRGVPDAAWYRQTLETIAPSHAELVRARALLMQDADRSFEVRFLQELFLFTKSSNPPETEKRLRLCLNPNLVAVFSQGAKVYVLPLSLTKASAVNRLNEILGHVFSFAAGDSQMDAGMLLAANKAFAPQALAQTMPADKNIAAIPDNCVFSDAFLRMLLEAGKAEQC